MDEEKKLSKPKDGNIVKKVFDRTATEKVSPLFTHSKKTPKVLVQPEATKEVSPPSKLLPVAVDFGTAGIKLVQLAQSAKGELEIAALDEESYTTTGADLALRQKEAFQRLLGRNSVGSSVVISLSAKEVQVLNFVFPNMSDKELEEAISWKIKQARPFDIEPERLQHGMIKWADRPVGQAVAVQQRVTVVCAPVDEISKKLEVLRSLGLKAVSVEVSPIALLNVKLFQSAALSGDETTLWLDLGADESTLAVEKNGHAYFFRSLTVASRQLTRQLAQGVPLEESRAEALKRLHGLSAWTPGVGNVPSAEPEDESAKVYHGIVSSLENLVIDIEHSFKYFSYQVSQSQINKFDRVMLAGGGAELKNLERFLADRLGVPVEKLNPFSGLKIQESVAGRRSALVGTPSLFGTAAGLALGRALPQAARLNLMPVPQKKTVTLTLKQWQKEPRKAAMAAAGVLVLCLGPQIARASYYKAQADRLDRTVRSAKADLSRSQTDQMKLAEEEAKLADKKKLLESKLELLGDSNREGGRFSNVLGKLSSLVPDEVWVTKLSYKENKMLLVGLTLNSQLVVNLVDALNHSDVFQGVTFNYAQKESNSQIYRFELVMGVK